MITSKGGANTKFLFGSPNNVGLADKRAVARSHSTRSSCPAHVLGAFVLQTNCLDHGRRNIREILCSLLALRRHDDVAGSIPPVDGTKARSPRRVHQGASTKARSPRRVHPGAFTKARTPGRVPRSSKLDSTTDVAACRQDPLKGQALTSSLVHGRRNAETTHG